MAFWNGRDPFLKERLFGLSGWEGNHGEDAKEYWWYVDATPTASWLSWRYHYPQSEFPYARLREENARRGRQDREFELIDTGLFDDDRYWQIVVDYAKAAPRDLCVRIQIRNAGPEAAELHVLPTLWFRNRWSWGDDVQRPSITVASAGRGELAMAIAEDAAIGRWRLVAGPDPTGRLPELVFWENETNVARASTPILSRFSDPAAGCACDTARPGLAARTADGGEGRVPQFDRRRAAVLERLSAHS